MKEPIELNPLFNQIDDWFTDLFLGEPIAQFSLLDKPVKNKNSNTRKKTNRKSRNDSKNDDTKNAKSLDSLARDLELLLGYDEDLSYYDFFNDDEISLLDESIGNCCTVSNVSNFEDKDELSISVTNMDEKPWIREHHRNKDLINTATPSDHDYLAKPQTKVLSNELIASLKHEKCSVLNFEAIRRFAKFSNQLRALGHRHASEINSKVG